MCWEHRTNRLLPCSSVVFCVVTRPACGPLGRGVQYGPVGTSAGQIKGSVTVPYTFHGEGSPLPRVAAARKAVFVSTDEDDLWAKQPVGRVQTRETRFVPIGSSYTSLAMRSIYPQAAGLRALAEAGIRGGGLWAEGAGEAAAAQPKAGLACVTWAQPRVLSGDKRGVQVGQLEDGRRRDAPRGRAEPRHRHDQRHARVDLVDRELAPAVALAERVGCGGGGIEKRKAEKAAPPTAATNKSARAAAAEKLFAQEAAAREAARAAGRAAAREAAAESQKPAHVTVRLPVSVRPGQQCSAQLFDGTTVSFPAPANAAGNMEVRLQVRRPPRATRPTPVMVASETRSSADSADDASAVSAAAATAAAAAAAAATAAAAAATAAAEAAATAAAEAAATAAAEAAAAATAAAAAAAAIATATATPALASLASINVHNFDDGPPFLRCSCPHGLAMLQQIQPTAERAALLAQPELSVWVDWGPACSSETTECNLSVRRMGKEVAHAVGAYSQPLRVAFARGDAAAGSPFLAELCWSGGRRRLHVLAPLTGSVRLDGLVLPPGSQPRGLAALLERIDAQDAMAPSLPGGLLERGFGLELELLTEAAPAAATDAAATGTDAAATEDQQQHPLGTATSRKRRAGQSGLCPTPSGKTLELRAVLASLRASADAVGQSGLADPAHAPLLLALARC